MDFGIPGNPYTASRQGFKLIKSAFCFLDILGYQELIAEAGEPAQQAYHQALEESVPVMLAELGHPTVSDRLGYPLFALKTFTDNIVIGWPIGEADGEVELAYVATAAGALQTQLALRGIFVRGAISVGPAYIDDFGVFGNALLEAYKGEVELARDPRVVLCQSGADAIHTHLGYYKDAAFAPQNYSFRSDADGQMFVSYLEHLAPAPEEGGFGLQELTEHGKQVEAKLEKFRNKPRLWAKYEWVARYHNHFCDRYSSFMDASQVKIRIDDFRAEMGDLVGG